MTVIMTVPITNEPKKRSITKKYKESLGINENIKLIQQSCNECDYLFLSAEYSIPCPKCGANNVKVLK